MQVFFLTGPRGESVQVIYTGLTALVVRRSDYYARPVRIVREELSRTFAPDPKRLVCSFQQGIHGFGRNSRPNLSTWGKTEEAQNATCSTGRTMAQNGAGAVGDGGERW